MKFPRGLRPLRALGDSTSPVVWLARDDTLDRLVVVKMLARAIADYPDARPPDALASRLSHPMAMRVHYVTEAGGRHWLVGEYIAGKSLADCAGRWQAPATLSLLLQLLDGLEAIADAGFAHADVAPDNVMIDALGRVRLIDFGIAMRFGETSPGTGTPGFAPPECVLGQPVTQAYDLWSSAALGVWLLSGRAPAWVEDARGIKRLSVGATAGDDALTARIWKILMQALPWSPEDRISLAAQRRSLGELARMSGDTGPAVLRSFGQGVDHD